jgi:hypothetical protein
MSRAGPNSEETLNTIFTALGSHAKEIRLVTLQAGYFNIDPIVCTLSSVRKLTNETGPGGRYRWYVTNTGVDSVGSTVATVR